MIIFLPVNDFIDLLSVTFSLLMNLQFKTVCCKIHAEFRVEVTSVQSLSWSVFFQKFGPAIRDTLMCVIEMFLCLGSIS